MTDDNGAEYDYEASERSWPIRKSAFEASSRGDTAKAMEYLRAALDIHEASIDAHCECGRLLVDVGDTDAAVAHYERALELLRAAPPDVAQAMREGKRGESNVHAKLGAAYLLRARRKRSDADWQAARREFAAALEIDDHNKHALWGLQICHTALGQGGLAIEALEQFVRLYPLYHPAWDALVGRQISMWRLRDAWRTSRRSVEFVREMHDDWRD